MSRMEIAKKLAEMNKDMDKAREERNKRTKKIYHQTNPDGWDRLKKVLAYQEPALER